MLDEQPSDTSPETSPETTSEPTPEPTADRAATAGSGAGSKSAKGGGAKKSQAKGQKKSPPKDAEPDAGPDATPDAAVDPEKKPAAKKRPAKKAASKKTAAAESKADEEPADTAGDADSSPAPRKRSSKKAAKPAAEGEGSGPMALFQPPPEELAPAAPARAEQADADGSEADGDGDQAGPARRRRRRGGRRRRKSGEGEGGADSESGDSSDDAADDTDPAEKAKDKTDNDKDKSEDGSGAQDESGDGGSSRRRRRRRRAGDSDGEQGDDPEQTVTKVRTSRSAEDEITSFTGSTRLEAKKQRRREGREAGRRRAPIISEAEFLARRESVDRAMVIRQRADLTQIAVLEDKVLVEHYVSRESQTSLIGNVYLGRVQNVLPSMEAAFIDIGKGRNAVLYAGEVNWDALGAKDGSQRKIEQVLKAGQAVLVQVTKDPVGHKGARLTSQISLPGRFLVYVPGGSTSGISRKLPDNERNRLKNLLKEIVPDTAGVIVRTAAEGASEQELTRDVERLKALWSDIETKVESGNAPALMYAEPDLTLKVVRDLFTEDIGKLVVSGEAAWEMVDGYVQHVAPDLVDRLEKHDDSERDAFADFRVDEQIAKALDRKVWLPSGGSLVIDRTEAMTVVDVNTGKFTGSGGNLEETVTKNNLEAAEEIVRQLRLRDIGGIIVVDFIDMVLESNRELVLRRLIECLGRDRTRHQVAEVTSLGLVQMTRKRIGTGLLEAFSEVCETCQGRGVLVHQEPVEPKKRATDEEPRRSRRGRGRGRDNQTDGSYDGSSESDSGKRPTPAEFAAMARAEKAKDAEDAEDAEVAEATQAAETADAGGPDQTGADQAPAKDAKDANEPEGEAGGTRIVTRVRRSGARRPAGPAQTAANPDGDRPDTAVAVQEAPSEAPEDAAGEPTEAVDGEAPRAAHVPIKKKGARKR